jgi:hypothetical protein
VLIEVGALGNGTWGGFSVVESEYTVVMSPDDQESPATEIACLRMYNSEGKAYGNRSIDCIPPCSEDILANVRR